MKRFASTCLLVGAMAVAYALSSPLVTGRGLLEFESHGHAEGRASFELFAERQGKRFPGRLLFSAEGIHIDGEPALSNGDLGYPDIVVTAETLDNVGVKGNVATIKTRAVLHREPVVIQVILTDSRSKSEPDLFQIRCDRATGQHLFHVEGPLSTGDIDVR